MSKSLLFIVLALLPLANCLAAAMPQRKIASQEVSEAELSKDFKDLRQKWLSVKTGEELELLLKKSLNSEVQYSDDTRFFLSQMQFLLPMRGIIWRVRPIFENQKNILRTKSALVLAVQVVRAALISLKMYIPSSQADALTEFLTLPSKQMSSADQFHSMEEIQDVLVSSFLPLLKVSIQQMEALGKPNNKTIIWDNHLAYGKSAIDGDLNRFIIHGPAEIHSATASLYRTYHDVLVFCSFNQNYLVRMLNDFNLKFAMDSSFLVSKSKRLGMTDEERGAVITKAISKFHYLELRPSGPAQMKEALIALRKSVYYAEKAINIYKAEHGQNSPVLLNNGDRYVMDIDRMKSLLDGPTDVQDPVSGLVIRLNLPAFYQMPPSTLGSLMTTKFDKGPLMLNIKNDKGEILRARNYLQGNALAWDNEVWKKYVPSAEGKTPAYMHETRRVFRAMREISFVYLLPEIIVH